MWYLASNVWSLMSLFSMDAKTAVRMGGCIVKWSLRQSSLMQPASGAGQQSRSRYWLEFFWLARSCFKHCICGYSWQLAQGLQPTPVQTLSKCCHRDWASPWHQTAGARIPAAWGCYPQSCPQRRVGIVGCHLPTALEEETPQSRDVGLVRGCPMGQLESIFSKAQTLGLSNDLFRLSTTLFMLSRSRLLYSPLYCPKQPKMSMFLCLVSHPWPTFKINDAGTEI